MEIIELLDKNIQNKVKFYTILQQEKKITKKMLIKKLKLTNFKLIQLTNEISFDLEHFNLVESLQLTIYKNEIELIELNPNSISHIQKYYLKSTPLYSYLLTAFYNQRINIDLFTLTHFISHTTFYRMLKKLNNYTHQMNIKFSSSGKIEGEEQKIRTFFVQLFIYIYKGTDYPFKFIKYDEIKLYLTYFYKLLGSSFDPIQESLYVYWIAISFERVHSQQLIPPNINGIYRPIKLDIGHTIKNNTETGKDRFDEYKDYFFNEYRRTYNGITEEQIRTELAFLLLIAFYHYIKSDQSSLNTNSLIVALRNTTRELQDTVYLWIEILTNQLDIRLSDSDLLKLSLNLFAVHIMSVSVNGLEAYELDKNKLINEMNLIDEHLLIQFNSFFYLLFSLNHFNELFRKHKDSLYVNYLSIILENITMFTKKIINISFVTQLSTQSELEIISTCPTYIKSHFNFISYNEDSTNLIIADTNYLLLQNSKIPIFYIKRKRLSVDDWQLLLKLAKT